MPPPRAGGLAGALAIVAAASLGGAAAGRQAASPSAQQQPPPTFRTGVTIVPVDVRVLDRDGMPVTDLEQSDFVLMEDGSPQDIRHFSARRLVPMPVPAETTPAVRTRGSSPMQEQSARIFLIVLGRGRLQYPSKGVDAMIHFVRNRLLPQDQVAVMAFNRATDFTTDRARILEVLERFRRRHEDIEAGFKHQTGGLAGIYGSRDPSPKLQRDIDAVFSGPLGQSARSVTPVPLPEREQAAAATRRTIDAVARAELVAGREQTIGDTFDLLAGEIVGLPFDAFVATSVQALQDMGNLYTGIEYLRYLEGEKHILFLTEQGFYAPRLEADASLAARANNARVVINTIQTGGLDGGPGPLDSGGLGPSITPRQPTPPVPSASYANIDMGRMQVLQSMSNLTGGLSATRQYAQPAVDRIDTATRFGYLLGYQPRDTRIDRRYRRITVRVNRPGVTVLFRHGYYADDVPLPIDRRTFLTSRRISAAGQYGSAIPDIRVTLTPTVKRTQGVAEVNVVLNIDASRIAFTTAEGRHVADLDLVIYTADDKERIIKESRHKVDLTLKDENYQRYLRDGIPFEVTMRAAQPPKYVKVIVYDYAADLLGSSIVKLK
ncbi:MAG: VWA domain-containing protein [Vicinamibacterales bacterium]